MFREMEIILDPSLEKTVHGGGQAGPSYSRGIE
jgi:hypothetical protein